MQAGPVVFALILGWISGDAEVPVSLTSWLTARETVGRRVDDASCVLGNTNFTLRQVVLESSQVWGTKPEPEVVLDPTVP
jgi:hypothetical protein